MDVPKAPKLLGALVGHAAVEKAVGLEELPELCTQCESVEPRRDLAASAFSYIKVRQIFAWSLADANGHVSSSEATTWLATSCCLTSV